MAYCGCSTSLTLCQFIWIWKCTSSCYSISLSTRLLSLLIWLWYTTLFYIWEESLFSLNKIYLIFHKLLQSCERKSFNNNENPSASGGLWPLHLTPLPGLCPWPTGDLFKSSPQAPRRISYPTEKSWIRHWVCILAGLNIGHGVELTSHEDMLGRVLMLMFLK